MQEKRRTRATALYNSESLVNQEKIIELLSETAEQVARIADLAQALVNAKADSAVKTVKPKKAKKTK